VAQARRRLPPLPGRDPAQQIFRARQLIQSLTRTTPVSFRMSNAGDPLYNWDAALAYDFYGLANAVASGSPKPMAVSAIGSASARAISTAAYARLCDPDKPLVWAEMGDSVWDMNRMTPDPRNSPSRAAITPTSTA